MWKKIKDFKLDLFGEKKNSTNNNDKNNQNTSAKTQKSKPKPKPIQQRPVDLSSEINYEINQNEFNDAQVVIFKEMNISEHNLKNNDPTNSQIYIDAINKHVNDPLKQTVVNSFKRIITQWNDDQIATDLSNKENGKIYTQLLSSHKELKIDDLDRVFIAPKTTYYLHSNRIVIYAVALCIKNKRPLLTSILDSYYRYFVKYNFHSTHHSKPFSEETFVKQWAFCKREMNRLPMMKHEIQHFYVNIIKEFHLRICGKPKMNHTYLIDDDMNAYVHFYASIQLYFEKQMQDLDLAWLQIQFDVMIIPKSIKKQNIGRDADSSGSDDDDDADVPKYNNEIDEKDAQRTYHENSNAIGDIAKKLKGNNIEFYHKEIPDGFGWPAKFERLFKEAKDAGIIPINGKRYVFILDRRPNKKNTQHIYIYEAMQGSNEISSYYAYLPVCGVASSKDCLLPKRPKNAQKGVSNQDIGALHTLNGLMFCVSFHLISQDCCRAYWFHQNSMIRFFLFDMLYVWPQYFEDDPGNKSQFLFKNRKDFKDVEFDPFHKKYNGGEIDHFSTLMNELDWRNAPLFLTVSGFVHMHYSKPFPDDLIVYIFGYHSCGLSVAKLAFKLSKQYNQKIIVQLFLVSFEKHYKKDILEMEKDLVANDKDSKLMKQMLAQIHWIANNQNDYDKLRSTMLSSIQKIQEQ